MQIDLKVDCNFDKTAPMCVFGSKNNSKAQTLKRTNDIVLDFDIEPKDFLSISFINKDDEDDNVIFIKKILVDGIDLQHFLLKGVFTPEYNMDWFNKQDPKPPSAYVPCTELRHKGVWEIELTTPVWKMIMEGWLNDDR